MVCERSITVVAQQLIRRVKLREVQVHPAVVVEVTGRHPHAVSEGDNMALSRDVGESQRAGSVCRNPQVVAVEPVRTLAARLLSSEL